MRRIIAAVVVLLLALGILEVVVHQVANHRVASATACALGDQRHGDIHATAHGFPLTYDVARGRLPAADVSTRVEGARVGVHLSDVGFRHGLTARTATVDAQVPWSVMRRQLPAEIADQYGEVALSADGDRLGVTVTVAGAPVRLDYALSVADDSIVLTPEKAVVGGFEVPVSVVRTMTGGAFADALTTRTVRPPLPLPADLKSATVTHDGLRLHLTLGPDALAAFARCA